MLRAAQIDIQLARVVVEAHRLGFSVQSDFARRKADYVAMAASMGLISTRLFGNAYGRSWKPTADGLTFLQAIDVDLFVDEES